MENKYIIKVDELNNILSILNTFDYSEDDIILSNEEYELALKHKMFNPATREFSGAIDESAEIESVEKLIKETHVTTQIVADDNIINMDMLLEVMTKIDMILNHLGL